MSTICGDCDECICRGQVPVTCNARQLVRINVRRLRQEADLSQRELSEIASIDRTHLARLETEAINVSLNVLAKLARALEVDPRELFCPREEWD
ncbi:MAG: helix-turn-helix domain-containing protein [Persicimonas sp.]